MEFLTIHIIDSEHTYYIWRQIFNIGVIASENFSMRKYTKLFQE